MRNPFVGSEATSFGFENYERVKVLWRGKTYLNLMMSTEAFPANIGAEKPLAVVVAYPLP